MQIDIIMLLGDNERAGGGFAPGFEAGIHRSSHPQVAEAACQTRREKSWESRNQMKHCCMAGRQHVVTKS